MTVREILKMGDPRLLRRGRAGDASSTRPALHALIADMFETMHAVNGAGLAAPQIGVNLQLVIFGFGSNQRYPDAPPVPETVLINPVLTPLSRRDGRGLRRLPVGARPARQRAALHPPALRRRRPVRPARSCRDVDGFHARVVQHEVDHLLGILYPMRIRDFSRFGYTEVMFPGTGRRRRLRGNLAPKLGARQWFLRQSARSLTRPTYEIPVWHWQYAAPQHKLGLYLA